MKKVIFFILFAAFAGCNRQNEVLFPKNLENNESMVKDSQHGKLISETKLFLEREIKDTSLFRKLDFNAASYYYGSNGEIRIISIPRKDLSENKFAFVYFSKKGLYGNWVKLNRNNFNLVEGFVSESFDNSITKTVFLSQNNSRDTLNNNNLPSSTTVSVVPRIPHSIELTIAGTLLQYITSPWSVLEQQNNNAGDQFSSQNEFLLPPENGGGGGGTDISETIEVEFDESDFLAKEDINKIFNCFDLIPDNGASYSVTMCTDVPINSNPTALTDYTGSPGHTFLIVTKSNGNSSISKSFGFYPEIGKTSIALLPVPSKIVNDRDHEINGSILKFLDKSQFETLKNKSIQLAGNEYDLNEYNCTDFALDVFNSTQVGNEISVEPVLLRIQGPNLVPVYTVIKSTPQSLFKKLEQMKQTYTPPATGGIMLSTDRQYRSPFSTGGCN